VPGLIDKWGSKEAWLQALYLRANIIWIFREEMMRLELGQLRWLEAILNDAYLNADTLAGRFATNGEAFDRCVQLLRNNIEQWIDRVGKDAELKRLLDLTVGVQSCDPIKEVFARIGKNTRAIYRMAPRRRVLLHLDWRSGHPLGSARPGEFPDSYHVNALTRTRPGLSEVELMAHLDEFGVPSFLVIPALLAHELVCHAYADEDRSDLQSIWAEGVMDWAAIFFYERWSIHLDWPYAPLMHRREDLWERRMTPARYTGHDVARTLVQWFARDASVRGLPMAQQVTARFVVEVNATPASLLAKDALASRIANIGTDAAIQGALRNWRAGADVKIEILR
jgi:hypothetical protein